MKKYFIVILSVILLINCGNRSYNDDTTEHTDTQNSNSELVVTDNCIIFLLPDSLEQEEMLERLGEESYNEVISDILYYNHEAQVVLEELGIKTVYCNEKYIKLVNSNGNVQKLKRSEIEGNMIVFHKDKSPLIRSAADFDENEIVTHLGITEIPYQSGISAKAGEFAECLREGKPLSAFFSDSWTLVYHSDNRADGSTDGRITNLRNSQIDSVIRLRVKKYIDDKTSAESGVSVSIEDDFDFELKKMVKHWDRFETIRYDDTLNHMYIVGAGASDVLKLRYNEEKQITLMEYSSEDPG